jgi:hypothetical protein
MNDAEIRSLLSKLNECPEVSSSFLGSSHTYESFAGNAEHAGFSLSKEDLKQLHEFVHAHSMQGWSLKSICGCLEI